MQKRQLCENKMENRRQWSDMFNELRKCNCQLVFWEWRLRTFEDKTVNKHQEILTERNNEHL